MTILILSKTWWRTLVKPEEGEARIERSRGEEIIAPPIPQTVHESSAEGEIERPVAPSFSDTGDDELEDEEPAAEGEEDVLGGGFDLDGGRPMRERGERMPWKSRVENSKDFFATELLYRFDILNPEDRKEIEGRYRIELKGSKGGIWTVLVGETLEILPRKEDAEIVLSLQHRDFLPLVNGDLNPQMALLAQKLKVTGDLRKASQFMLLLTPHVD